MARIASLLGFLAIAVIYWYLASFETWNIFQLLPSNPFDALVLSLESGRATIPPESLWYEKITTPHGTVMYFGALPALLRIPVLTLFPNLYGQLGGISCFLAAMTSVVCVYVLLRGAFKENSRLKDTFALVIACGVGLGSPIAILIAVPTIYDEAILWGAAFSLLSLLLSRETLESDRDHSISASLFYGCTFLTRVTFGFPWLLYSLLLFFLRGCPQGWKRAIMVRLPLVCTLAFQGWYNYARFDSPFTFIRYEHYEQESVERAKLRASLGTFSSRRVPYATRMYLFGEGRFLSATFPWGAVLACPSPNRPALFFADEDEPCLPLANSAPWITFAVLTALAGLAFRAYRTIAICLLFQLFLLTSHYAMTLRYTTEFLPFAILGIYFGVRELQERKLFAWRAVLIVFALFSVVAIPYYRESWIQSQSMIPAYLRVKYARH